MKDINSVVKDTLINLRKNNKLATPSNYTNEFLKISKKYKLSIQESEDFKKYVKQLNSNEKIVAKKLKIETTEELVPLLLKRVASKNVKNLANLMNNSLVPSISIELNGSLSKFSIKLGDEPALIFEDDIQKEMQNFINKRYEADKAIVKQKTTDIAKLVTLMGKYLNDAISSTKQGYSSVSHIKDELESFSLSSNNFKQLSSLQSQLISAATSIEDEMHKAGKNFSSSKNHVNSLEKEISKLKNELSDVKEQGKYDHLTDLLTRKAYEIEVKNFENNYQRNGVFYALVFLDIDHFKIINDNYGHDAGDVVLKTFARVLKRQTRKIDIIGRYGGEEFVAIVHYDNQNDLIQYLSRIKKIISDNDFIYKDKTIHIEFCAGVTLRHNYETYEDTLSKADALLYDAKNSGRNRIILEDGTVL